jgi:hypothetical protein
VEAFGRRVGADRPLRVAGDARVSGRRRSGSPVVLPAADPIDEPTAVDPSPASLPDPSSLTSGPHATNAAARSASRHTTFGA